MSEPARRRLSPSMIVALLALFVAMTGTATATTAALITGKQIANGSITGADIRNASIGKNKLVGTFRGPAGPPGPAGSIGPAGPAGPAGVAPDTTQFYKKAESDGRFLHGTVTVVAASGAIANNTIGVATATCPAGHQVLGGGGAPWNVTNMYVTSSYPLVNNADTPVLLADGQYGAATAWRVVFRNETGGSAIAKAVAVCAPIG